MRKREPHPEALRNFENALLSESKVRYPLRDPDKRKPFGALGYGEESGNWEELRDRIIEELPHHPALLFARTQWGENYRVDMLLAGPGCEKAPVRTGWIYLLGEDFPRLTTLYVKTDEWRRMSKRGRIGS